MPYPRREYLAGTKKPSSPVHILRLPPTIHAPLPVRVEPDVQRGPQAKRRSKPQPTGSRVVSIHEVSCSCGSERGEPQVRTNTSRICP